MQSRVASESEVAAVTQSDTVEAEAGFCAPTECAAAMKVNITVAQFEGEKSFIL